MLVIMYYEEKDNLSLGEMEWFLIICVHNSTTIVMIVLERKRWYLRYTGFVWHCCLHLISVSTDGAEKDNDLEGLLYVRRAFLQAALMKITYLGWTQGRRAVSC